MRNKRASKGEKTVIGKPQTLTQEGHEITIVFLLNKNEQKKFIFTYDETNMDKLGK